MCEAIPPLPKYAFFAWCLIMHHAMKMNRGVEMSDHHTPEKELLIPILWEAGWDSESVWMWLQREKIPSVTAHIRN